MGQLAHCQCCSLGVQLEGEGLCWGTVQMSKGLPGQGAGQGSGGEPRQSGVVPGGVLTDGSSR